MKNFTAPFFPAALLVAFCLLPWQGVFAASWEDEFSPEGVWYSRIAYSTRVLDSAFDAHREQGQLKDYLIRDEITRGLVDGDIERGIERYDFLLSVGMSDSWNLFFQLPYLRLEQISTLSTVSGDAAANAAVNQLGSFSDSGFGDFRVTNVHRPHFSDRKAFLWGYGLQTPVTKATRPYVDNTTFDLGSRLPGAFIFFHFTVFPSTPRSRWDFRAETKFNSHGWVAASDGTEKYLAPGNEGRINFGWRQEFGNFGTELEFELAVRQPSTLADILATDGEQAAKARLHLDYGNMARLEQGAVAFPFRVNLQLEKPVSSFSTPYGSGVALALQFFF